MARLIEALHRLPGIGPKTAQRLTYHMVRMPVEEARSLSEAILAIKTSISFCSSCQNITEADPCPLCNDPRRDRSQLCVVEEPLDILPMESAANIPSSGSEDRLEAVRSFLEKRTPVFKGI